MIRKTSRPRSMWTASTLGRSLRSASLASHVVKWFSCSNVFIYFCVLKSSIMGQGRRHSFFLFTPLLQRAV